MFFITRERSGEYPMHINKPKQNEWFERLLNFHKLFGVTYRGYGLNINERLFCVKKFLLCFYEIIVTILLLYILWSIGNGSGHSKSKLRNSGSKKSLLPFLFLCGSFSAIVEQIANKSVIFFNGPQILSTIRSFRYYPKPMPVLSKVKICLFIAIYFFSLISGIVFTLNDLNSIIRDLKDKNFQILLIIFGGLYCGITETSIVILMNFTSDLVRREINDLTLSMKNKGNIDFICK
jgi:hypothetical protein